VELAEKLEARGFSCAALNGDMTQVLREKTVERLKKGSLDIVVATDVAARGLDVKRISHVVNYDIPYDTEAYIHRIGRTGRAGREGKAILFVAPRERRMLYAIEQATRQPIKPMSLPSRKDITDRRVGLFKEQIAEVMEAEDLEFFEELIDSYQDEYDVGFRRIAATLAFLVQKERPLQPEESAEAMVDAAAAATGTRGGRFAADAGKRRYRIEVGRVHGVEPRHIVGAITNEAQLASSDIGAIKLFHDFSLVDLPEQLSQESLNLLFGVWVCGQQLRLSVDAGPGAGKPAKFAKKRNFNKGGKFKPAARKPPRTRK